MPVSEVWRSGRVESIHRGCAAVAEPGGRILALAGDPGMRSYLRSAAKPVQLLVMLEEGLDQVEGLDHRSLAVMAASHGGEPNHIALVEGLLARAGLAPADLQCGASPPLEEEAATELLRGGHTPRPIHNNCSGKHAAMLWTCRVRGWPTSTYLEPTHPLQVAITTRIAALAGEEPGIGVDGCSVPTFFVSVAGAARMTARLMELASVPGPAARVVSAMTAEPWYTSATSRFPFLLMAAAPALLAKEGAEGFFIVGIPAHRSPWGCAAGFALKVVDGAGERARGREPGIVHALQAAGVLSAREAARLEGVLKTRLVNAAGRVVGEIRGTLALEAAPAALPNGQRSAGASP